jgi:radical SAM protein with 4Fe4S-binding SPASM domain
MDNLSRVELYKYLPLETPFSLHVFPIHKCNFKCKYCLHSLSDIKLKDMKFKKETMSFNIFQKAIDGLINFIKPLKSLIIAGHGEPLLHPDITEMVAYAKKSNITERVEIVTNGSLLNKLLSDKLINAGLDRLRVSLQGLDSDAYKTTSGIKIDFNKFVDNLEYFYKNKKITNVYIKIIDMALHEDENKFYNIFNSISDFSAIEYTIPFVKEIDVSNYSDLNRAKQGHKVKPTRICSMPFYMLVLLPSGDVTGCCAVTPPVIYGSIKDDTLKNIWNNRIRFEFLKTQINNRWDNKVCKDCAVPNYGLQLGDELDPHIELVSSKYC